MRSPRVPRSVSGRSTRGCSGLATRPPDCAAGWRSRPAISTRQASSPPATCGHHPITARRASAPSCGVRCSRSTGCGSRCATSIFSALAPDPPAGVALRLRREPPRVEAILREWPRIRAEIDAGHRAVVGLIRATGNSPWRLTQNHQVLAWGWEAVGGRVALRVYDPNHPGRDDVELRAVVADAPGVPWRDRVTMTQTTGEPLLGFFRQPYPATTSVRAWR